MKRRPGRGGRVLAHLAALSALCLTAAEAPGRLLVHEPPPWLALEPSAGGRQLRVTLFRFDDARTGWRGRGLSVCGVLAAGGRGAVFLRLPYLGLDTGAARHFARWPELAGEALPEGWPGESINAGFGAPEIGYASALSLPLIGAMQAAVTGGLPIGRDALYPFSSTSMPVRLQLRKQVALGAAWRAALLTGRTMSIDSARDRFDAAAYPSTLIVGAGLELNHGARRGGALDWRGEQSSHAVSSRLSLCWRFPAGPQSSLELRAEREFAGADERACDSQVAVTLTAWGDAPAAAGGRLAN